MQKYIIALGLLTLTACSMGGTPTPENTPAPTASSEVAEVKPCTPGTVAVGPSTIAFVRYTLRDTDANGKVLDTNVANVAQENGLNTASNEPLQVMIGQNTVIPGFEKGLIGMKGCEKKTIVVSPEEGYGPAIMEQKVAKYEIAPEFSITLPREKFEDTVTQEVPLANLGEDPKTITVGKKIYGGPNKEVEATVKAINGEKATIVIDNKGHPFYGKKLTVGATASVEGMNWKITKLAEKEITFDIVNSKSPFAGKKFEVGATADIGTGKTLTIKGFSGDVITIDGPNQHPLAGKTLHFDVEITDVK